MLPDIRNEDHFLLLYCPCSSLEEAERIATSLVESRLVACANIIDRIKSVYWWDGEVQKDDETLLLAKTIASNKEQIISTVKELHTYDLPAIVFYKLESGNKEYLEWITKECSPV
ncbi:MAG: divalent-cation tolerance protein CutA [Candidatus Odinarchaeota archaeon]